MISNEDVKRLVEEELERANQVHSPTFSSGHETYAVIKEELEEVEFEVERLQSELNCLWTLVKHDVNPKIPLKKMREYSEYLIGEAIQVSAMCVKGLNSNEIQEVQSK